MPLHGDLGFSGPVLVVFAILIAGFAVRRKWMAAAARREEVMRLVALAAEESVRAEMTAVMEYGEAGGVVRYQCAVCYSPTTTRCSRCKAVRYCSGKCQIVHWRHGHKEECHPPPSVTDPTGLVTYCGLVLTKSIPEEPISKVNNFGALQESSLKPLELSAWPASSRSCYSFQGPNEKDANQVEVISFQGSRESNSLGVSSSNGCFMSTSPKDLWDEVHVDGTMLNTSCERTELHGANDSSGSHGTISTECPESASSVCTSFFVNNEPWSSKIEQSLINRTKSDHSSSSSNCSDECAIDEPSMASAEQAKTNIDSSSSQNIDKDDRETQTKSFLQFSFNLSVQGVSSGSHLLVEDGKADVLEKLSIHEGLSNCQNEKPEDATSSSEIVKPVPFVELDTVKGLMSRSQNGKADRVKESVKDGYINIGQPILDSERLPPTSRGGSQEEGILNPRKQKSSSSDSSSEHQSTSSDSSSGHQNSSADGRRSFADSTISKVDSEVDNASSGSAGMSDTIASTIYGANALRMSMKKAVQQLKSSKLSKHCNASVLGTETSEKDNSKTLFPYDLFTKFFSWDKVELRPCGLINCGNSCYANAVLQCLAFTRPLTAYLLQGLHSKTCAKRSWCFTCEFESLLLKMKEGKSPLSPIGILSQIKLGHGKEEDAHEFLRHAIDAMQSVCLLEAGVNNMDQKTEESTLIQWTFGGYLKSKIKCMKCQGKSERCERIMDLTVEIHGNISTLEEALHQFTSTETLEGQNKYQCSRCKSYEKAKKKLTILEAPNILTIVLKRFQSGKFGKLNKTVKFPEILDLTPYMSGAGDKSPIYRLYAVVVHLDIMNAAFSGHYVCYVKSIQGKWYKIDDSQVKHVEVDRVLSKGAYMLLYSRCSPRAQSLTRNSVAHDCKTKKTKCNVPVPLSSSEKPSSRSRSNSTARRRNDPQYHVIADARPCVETPASFNQRSHPVHWIPKVDSSSDSSSLFSCSDEGSCSTESTRDSTSTDDLSEYIFGDSGRFSSYSPLRGSDEFEVSATPTSSPSPTTVSSESRDISSLGHREAVLGKGRSPSLFSDIAKHRRKVVDSNSSSSSSETDRDILGRGSPQDMKSVVTLRRCRDRSHASFY